MGLESAGRGYAGYSAEWVLSNPASGSADRRRRRTHRTRLILVELLPAFYDNSRQHGRAKPVAGNRGESCARGGEARRRISRRDRRILCAAPYFHGLWV